MPDYSTSMKDWGGGFAPAQVGGSGVGNVQRNYATEALAGAIGNAIDPILTGAGKAYARGQGNQLLGDETTHVEAREAVKGYDEAVSASSQMDAAINAAEIADIKENALRQFGTDYKKIQALVTAGRISPLEASARFDGMLKHNLSNPILAMFQKDFVDAAAPYTGGSGQAAQEYFGYFQPTEEQRKALVERDMVLQKDAAYRGAVRDLENKFGFSQQQAQDFMRKAAEEEARVKRLQQQAAMFSANSVFKLDSTMASISNTSSKVSLDLMGRIAEGSPLSPEEVVEWKNKIAIQHQNLVNSFRGMSGGDYSQARSAADAEMKRLSSILSDNSAQEALKTATEMVQNKFNQFAGEAAYELASQAPSIVAAQRVGGDKFMEVYIGTMAGNMGKRFTAQTSPVYKSVVASLEGMDQKAAQKRALDKVANIDTPVEFNPTDANAFSLAISHPNAAKALAQVKPEAQENVKTAMQQTFANGVVDLSILNSNQEWKTVLSRGDEGLELGAAAIKGAIQKMRAMQAMSGGFPKSVRIEEYVPDTEVFTNVPSYTLKVDGATLNEAVQNNLAHMAYLLDSNPKLLDKLGFSSRDSLLDSIFDVGGQKPKMASSH